MRTVIACMSAVVVWGLGACGEKKPAEPAAATTTAPAPEADTAQAPAPEADAAQAAAPEADTAQAPAEADATASGPLAPIAPERLAALAADPTAPDPTLLSRVAACASRPDSDGCGFIGLVGVAGFRPPADVALVTTEDIGSCAEVDRLAGRVAPLADLAAGTAKPLTDPSSGDEPTARPVWTWLARLAKDGFTPATDLIKARASEPSGIRSHTPTVALGPPLDGWVLDAVTDGERAVWRLASPDRAQLHLLGALPHARATCTADDKADGLCADYTFPSTLQVVLAPDRAHLLVTVTLGDGTHCGTDRVAHALWALPAGVAPAP